MQSVKNVSVASLPSVARHDKNKIHESVWQQKNSKYTTSRVRWCFCISGNVKICKNLGLPSGWGCDLKVKSIEKSGPSQSLWQARGKTGSNSTRRDSKYARMVSSATLDSLQHKLVLCNQIYLVVKLVLPLQCRTKFTDIPFKDRNQSKCLSL